MRMTAAAASLVLLLNLNPATGQGFLHRDGRRIVDRAGENVLLRGIGTGNWMLQEGYMMETDDVAGTQHEFRDRLVQTIGEAQTDSFYMVWLENHCTRADIDSMASWGFNSVRVAMHYKWFTLPIAEEPVQGENTWLDRGFRIIDSLLGWCGDNRMYLILDLHGAPGGQGKNASISDYDPSELSLWESQENRDKTVALWQRLAQKYRDEPWIGGYDLINETNWSFPGGNNAPLRNLFVRITDSIRAVDPNHLVIIEGNGFANDFSGLTPPWDANMAYSFHKYWTFNNPGAIDWVLQLRDSYNIPLWMGESGENSNTWFTNFIALCEAENIGWSWWPVKKGGINNPLRVEINEDYLRLVDNWRGNGPFLTPGEAFQAVLEFARRHHIDNCIFQRDVVDAMLRQPATTATLPFVSRTVPDTIYASEYDLGRNSYAYFDQDTADYHGDMDGTFTSWNQGWSFRNDGVDLEPCQDTVPGTGYNVGWTADDEWLAFTMSCDSAAAWDLEVRSASGASGSRVHIEVNGADATGPIDLPSTGGWQSWVTTGIEGVILPEGEVTFRVVFDRGGSNLHFFRFLNARPDTLLPFRVLSAVTPELGDVVYLSLNKRVTAPATLQAGDFTLYQGTAEVEIDSITIGGPGGRVLAIHSSLPLFYNQSLKISYRGNTIYHGDQSLSAVSMLAIQNHLARHYPLPARIQAENFYRNSGLELENCLDAGGGLNTGYANAGDYLDYLVYVPEAGDYDLHFRIATERYNARLRIQKEAPGGFGTLGDVSFDRTGGWQNWTTQSAPVNLEQGKYLLRLLVTGEEHNLNWIEFTDPVSIGEQAVAGGFTILPNPATDRVTIIREPVGSKPSRFEIIDAAGKIMYTGRPGIDRLDLDVSGWRDGLYLVMLKGPGIFRVQKLLLGR